MAATAKASSNVNIATRQYFITGQNLSRPFAGRDDGVSEWEWNQWLEWLDRELRRMTRRGLEGLPDGAFGHHWQED